MKLSTSVLTSVALATVASGLVLPSIDQLDSLFSVSHDTQEVDRQQTIDRPRNVVAPSPEQKNKLAATAKAAVTGGQGAPVIVPQSQDKPVIPHRYIVVFKKGVSPEEISFHKQLATAEQVTAAGKLFEENPSHDFFAASSAAASTYGKSDLAGGILHEFDINGLLTGYAGYFLDPVIELLRHSPLVEYIEKDSVVTANKYEVQNGAPWGLARVSHRSSLNLGSFNKYLYDSEGGDNVNTYIIDTGVLDTHSDFEGRAKLIDDIPNDGALDGNGHGTHCSGTIGGKTYGVAKKVHIRGVKVLGANGSGTMSDVVKGVEVAAKDHIKKVKEGDKKFKGSSANMSLGGGKSPSLDAAVNAAVQAGINFAVAAGNENQDACNVSPAAAEGAITVGASTISDSRAYFSNWGKCVDIFAPGLNILSTYIGSNTATATLSGTSMASPHVAGLLAYYLSLAPDSKSQYGGSSSAITPAQLKKNLIAYGSEGALSDIGRGSPNILAFNGAGEDLDGFWKAGSTVNKSDDNKDEFLNKDNVEDKIKSSVHELEDKIESLIESLL